MARELMTRRTGLLIVALALAGLLSLGGAGSVPAELDVPEEETDSLEDTLTQQADADVVINILDSPPRYSDETSMAPVSLVLSGQTVEWQWEGGLAHSVSVDFTTGEPFDSGVQREDGNGDPYTFEMTFDEPGVYKVMCQVHLSQHGAIVVV